MTYTDTRRDAPGVMTGDPLIESDRVEGTSVYGPMEPYRSIKRLMIEKLSGKVTYAVMSFGGFLGLGEEEHTIPWNKLEYDTELGGYRTDITENQLRDAPTFIARTTIAGRIASASASCTTTGRPPITGVSDHSEAGEPFPRRSSLPYGPSNHATLSNWPGCSM